MALPYATIGQVEKIAKEIVKENTSSEVSAEDIKAEGIEAGQVLTANGEGGVNWGAVSGGTKLYRHSFQYSGGSPFRYLFIYSTEKNPADSNYKLSTLITNAISITFNKKPVLSAGIGDVLTLTQIDNNSIVSIELTLNYADTVTEL